MPRVAFAWRGLALGVSFVAVATGSAQEASSSAAVKEFAALAGGDMRYIAAKVPGSPDEFVGALHIPGVQLVVVWSRYQQPTLLTAMLGKGDHQGVYSDLHSASYSIAESRAIYEDMHEDGLSLKKRGGDAADTYEAGGKRVQFDGDWKKQKLSEQDYQSAFTAAEERYSKAIALLIAELKKGS